MNAVEIEEAVSALAEAPFDAGEFPFAFLTAFGNKAVTVQRLRAGSGNASDVEGGVLQRNNIHMAVCAEGRANDTLTALRDSPKTAANKVKFILVTDGLLFLAEDLNSGEAVACTYADFPDHFGFFLPLAGISTVKQIRESSFDIRATSRLNRLYVELLKDNPDWATAARRPDMNHFMARLIFCFFAEDTDIFNGTGLFTATVAQMGDRDPLHQDARALLQFLSRSASRHCVAPWPSLMQPHMANHHLTILEIAMAKGPKHGIRQRLVAITATGPVYLHTLDLAVIPYSSGLALLQELAKRVSHKRAEVVSSLAQRVEGREAYLTWLYLSTRIALGLFNAPPRFKLMFLRSTIDFIRQQKDAEGLEPIMAATMNAAWPFLSAERARSVATYFMSRIERSKYAERNAILVCDPSDRSFTMVAPGELAKTDVAGWVEWRSTIGGAWGAQGQEAGDFGINMPGRSPGSGLDGLGGGMDSGGLRPGSAGWSGGMDPGAGPWGRGGSGMGGIGDRFGGLGPNGRGGFGPNPDDGTSGIDWTGPRSSGAAGWGPGGAGMGGAGWQGTGSQSGGLGAGGLFSGGEAGSGGYSGLGAMGGLGPIDFSKPGGPFGTGSYLGTGGEGASDFWGDAAQVVGKVVQGAGAVATTIGTAEVIAGIAQGETVVLAVTGAGFAITGTEVIIGGLVVAAVGASVEQWGKSHNEAEKAAAAAPAPAPAPQKSDPAPQPVITIPTVVFDDKKDDPPKPKDAHPGDLYPDPDGGGIPSPNQLPDFDGAGGGRPNSMWDENGGGGRPNSIAGHASMTVLVGAGLRAAIVQTGPQVYRI